MKSRSFLAVCLLGALCTGLVAQDAADVIRQNDIEADMYFLAADEMAGRKTASNEARIASNYIASEFMRLGLKPVGDDATYFQKYDLVTAWPDTENMALIARTAGLEKSYQIDHDFDLTWVLQSNNPATATAPLVFLGYGINAPEYGYNDFSGVDFRGKIVMILTHEPQESDPNSKFKGKWHTVHAYDMYKYEKIRQAGAAGILVVRETRLHRGPWQPSAPQDFSFPTPIYMLAGRLWDLPVFGITEETANELIRSSGKTIAALQRQIDASFKPQSFEVGGITITMKKALKDRHVVQGRNVVALLEGSDPNLKNEYVVISGHYDHVGTVGGRIYRGADDNASGTIGVLESARAFVLGNVHPKRSILFAAWDSEEAGLLGAFYYVERPIFPLANTVANLNMDMIGRDEDTPTWKLTANQTRNNVNIDGTLYNPDIRRLIEKNNERTKLNLDFKTDTDDPEEWFARSDHFCFATKSVPMVLFNTGEHPDYHTENDTWDKINYPKMERIIRLLFLTGSDLANATERPKFTP